MEADVLVVGAGMAGLVAARGLVAGGARVVLVDKARAVGGRMATRTIGQARFDHGAQHLIARTAEFAAALAEWEAAGAAAPWTGVTTRPDAGPELRHVGARGMRRIPEHLAAGLDVRLGTKVDRLDREGGMVTAVGASGPVAAAPAALVTAPVPQALALVDAWLGGADVEGLAAIEYEQCLAVMVEPGEPTGWAGGYAEPDAGPVAWMADNQHKGVSPVPAVTVHSTPEFAADPPEDWVDQLVDAAGVAAPEAAPHGHRWRYSRPRNPRDDGCLDLPGTPLVALAGEAFAGARVEGAFLSGLAAAARFSR